MADNSFAWARRQGLLRTNEVHGMEEPRLVLEESFINERESGSVTELAGSHTVEDANCFAVST